MLTPAGCVCEDLLVSMSWRHHCLLCPLASGRRRPREGLPSPGEAARSVADHCVWPGRTCQEAQTFVSAANYIMFLFLTTIVLPSYPHFFLSLSLSLQHAVVCLWWQIKCALMPLLVTSFFFHYSKACQVQ